ncbi:MAG: hypothetical protein HOK30_25850 [Rhodospirillaceae bacterium]|nr:hypothetical protein [Rhodospirillaceae bacterium]MBT6431118.1 hypothetical protein [Rhodospirillaceae bacterium]MBT7759796.1 hypothetical protein [Rhodospirillaceae bacterium]
MAHQALGLVLGRAGRSEEALSHITQAIRLSPRDLFLPGFLALGSVSLFALGRYEDALDWATRSSRSPNPRPLSFIIATAALNKLGRDKAAADTLAGFLAHSPISSVQKLRGFLEWNFPLSAEINEQCIIALRKAGLPEK